MYLDNEFYSLKLRKKRLVFKTALESLDTQILWNGTFTTFELGFTRWWTHRIRFWEAVYSRIKKIIDEGKFAVDSFFPSNINEIKALADADLIMPPKSTLSNQSLEAE
jgi:uncharacterized protein (DUF1015 family)